MIPNYPLRRLAASKLFLLGCIIISIGVFASAASAFAIARPELDQMLTEMMNEASARSPETFEQMQLLYPYLSAITLASGIIFSLVLSSVPAVAAWLIYGTARSSRASMRILGFTIFRIYLLFSLWIMVFSLVASLLESIGSDSFYSITSTLLEGLMNVAMLIAARKLLFASIEVIKTGKTNVPITNQCPILILINLFVAIGSLAMQLYANFYPNPVGQMGAYLFADKMSLISGLAASVVGIAEYAVFYRLSRKGIEALTADNLPEESAI